MLNVGMCNCETILLSLCSCLFACDIRVAIVGGQEQKHYSPPGTKLYFHVNSVRKNSIVSTRNMHGRLVSWLQTKGTLQLFLPL